MPRPIWDGRGEMPDGAVYFTKRDGVMVGRLYVRARLVAAVVRDARAALIVNGVPLELIPTEGR